MIGKDAAGLDAREDHNRGILLVSLAAPCGFIEEERRFGASSVQFHSVYVRSESRVERNKSVESQKR